MPGASSITRIKCRWDHGIQIFYDAITFETVHVNAPYHFYDDFTGLVGQVLNADVAQTWGVIDVSAAGLTTPIILPGTAANAATGVVHLMMAVGSNEAQDSGIYWADQTPISLYNDVQIEFRLALHDAIGAATQAMWGVEGAHNADGDTVDESAWFRVQGDQVLTVETDDTTNDEDTVATGITLVADEFHIFRIDFANMADVKFYVDGVRVGQATTLDMTNLSAIEAMIQPIIKLDHGAVAQAGSIYLDSVRIWGTRTSRQAD